MAFRLTGSAGEESLWTTYLTCHSVKLIKVSKALPRTEYDSETEEISLPEWVGLSNAANLKTSRRIPACYDCN